MVTSIVAVIVVIYASSGPVTTHTLPQSLKMASFTADTDQSSSTYRCTVSLANLPYTPLLKTGTERFEYEAHKLATNVRHLLNTASTVEVMEFR